LKTAEGALIKLKQQDLGVRVAFKLSRLIQELIGYSESMEQVRKGLVIKYSTNTVEGVDATPTIDPNRVKDFIKDYNELAATEIEVFQDKIKLSEIPDTVKLSADEATDLAPFIDTES
jgi:hypothetical protein